MRSRSKVVALSLLLVLPLACSWGCGSKKTEETTPDKPADGDAQPAPAAATPEQEKEQAIASAQDRIKAWLGQELSTKVTGLGKELGGGLGAKLAADSKVHEAAGKLTGAVFKDPELKSKLDRISDKATSGLGNKLKLGWKVIKAGGVDNYKKQVKAEAMRIAKPVITEHIKGLLKDPRMSELLKGFGPALKVQGKIAAMAVEENLSPRISKKIFGIALRIASAGDNAGMSNRVEQWIGECDDDASREVEKLMRGVAALPSVAEAVSGLAVEVLEHERTKREIAAMAMKIVDDPEGKKKLTKVYEAASLQHGETKIKKSIEAVIALPLVDQELFATMTRLTTAEGAGPIISKHASKVATDPQLAELTESFIINLLETCGDPTEESADEE